MTPDKNTETDPLPPRRFGLQPRTILVLAVIWVILWGEYTLFFLISGVLVGLIITLVFPMPPVWFAGRFRPLRALQALAGLLVDIVRSSISVVATVLRPGPPVRSGIIRVNLLSDSDLYEALTCELVNLIPGTLVVEARRSTRSVYLHVLDIEADNAVDDARDNFRKAELRVLRALASKDEIQQALSKEGA